MIPNLVEMPSHAVKRPRQRRWTPVSAPHELSIAMPMVALTLVFLCCCLSENNLQEDLFDQILAGKLEFPAPYWDNITDSAKVRLRPGSGGRRVEGPSPVTGPRRSCCGAPGRLACGSPEALRQAPEAGLAVSPACEAASQGSWAPL